MKFVKKITGYGMIKQYVSEINSTAHLMPARYSISWWVNREILLLCP
jgi:hypothetical protein